MFSKASFRLTAWYVAILMALSLAFSAWVYTETTHEVRNSLNAQLLQPFMHALPRDEVITYLDKQYRDSQLRILGNLVLLNVGVLIAGSVVSYALARRTLKPIEAALDAQNRFTADASHELRTPLTTMKTELEVALRDQSLNLNDARGLLKSSLEETDRLSRLVSGLLILARTGEKPALTRISLADIAGKACDRFERTAGERHITIQRNIKPVTAVSDASQTDTIIGVLLDNAIKYSPEKSVVTVKAARANSKAYVSVHNAGEPIPPESLPHIFERFYRADRARTGGETAGHGLGLSIAQKLTVNINGTLSATSDAKNGTTFTLELPRA